MYRHYFQKSKIFLYPLLGIKKGIKYVPVETYFTWEDNYELKDKKLICVYKQKRTKRWLEFEDLMLLKNKLFFDYKHLGGDMHLYVFDVSLIDKDYDRIVKGKYSEISKLTKNFITKFFGESGLIAEYIDQYLHPEYYHEEYAYELNVDEDLIKKVWELCDKPDLKKETLVYKLDEKLDVFNNKLLSLHINNKYLLDYE